jgi:hypothetical protein
VARNLALHGTLWGWSVSDADITLGELSGSTDESLGLNAVGGGVTFYAMPANIYFSGSLGLAWLSTDDASSGTGVALDVTIGKEWWVGNSWGLGLAAAVGFHSIPEEDADESWSGGSLGLRFSATLN